MKKIKVMIDETTSFTQKPSGKDMTKIYNNLRSVELSLEELVTKIEQGKTWCPAILNGSHASDWVSQQLFCVDYDNHPNIYIFYRDSLIKKLKPILVYQTFSHESDKPRFRAVWMINEPITSEQERIEVQKKLFSEFPGADPKCLNANRYYFGTNKKVKWFNPDSLLSKEELGIQGIKVCNKYNKTKKTIKSSTTNEIVSLIKNQNANELKSLMNCKKKIFENNQELWDFIYGIDIARFLNISSPKSFQCILHSDIHPSASIFYTPEGVCKYKCFSCMEKAINIRELVELLGKFKSSFKATRFIMEIFNLEVKKSEWAQEQEENLNRIQEIITTNEFAYHCPTADKTISYSKEALFTVLTYAKNNILTKKYLTKDDETIFFLDGLTFAKLLGKTNSKKQIENATKHLKLLCAHDILRVLSDEEIPEELLKKARKNGKGSRVNFYAIPSWVYEQLNQIEYRANIWKENKYTLKGLCYDMFYLAEGQEFADKIYPAYNLKTRTKTEQYQIELSEQILSTIEKEGYILINTLIKNYSREKRISTEVAKKTIAKVLPSILTTYFLEKKNLTKKLKEKYNIKIKGFPCIIIPVETEE